MAPSALIDATRVHWIDSGPQEAQARFDAGDISVTARLHFDAAGRLSNFVSGDRFMSSDGKTFVSYPWSTPISAYEERDGRLVPSTGELVWHMPEGDFTYGQFHLVNIEYNVRARAVP